MLVQQWAAQSCCCCVTAAAAVYCCTAARVCTRYNQYCCCHAVVLSLGRRWGGSSTLHGQPQGTPRGLEVDAKPHTLVHLIYSVLVSKYEYALKSCTPSGIWTKRVPGLFSGGITRTRGRVPVFSGTRNWVVWVTGCAGNIQCCSQLDDKGRTTASHRHDN